MTDQNKMFTNSKNIEFYCYIWNHHGKCIKISTNMPSIGLVICEMGCKIWEFDTNKILFYIVKPLAAWQVLTQVTQPKPIAISNRATRTIFNLLESLFSGELMCCWMGRIFTFYPNGRGLGHESLILKWSTLT